MSRYAGRATKDKIKRRFLEKISGEFAIHPNDYMPDVLFAQQLIKYCIRDNGLHRGLLKIVKKMKKRDEKILYPSIKLKKISNDPEALINLVKKPELNKFVSEEILINNVYSNFY